MKNERLGNGWLLLFLLALACFVVTLFIQSEKIASLRSALAAETTARATDAATATGEYNALLYEKNVLQQDREDLKQIIADLTAQNNSFRKQLTTAQKRPTTFTVYQETYPGSPIGKSPFALRFREEGILRTGCGNFIFRARR